MFYRRKIILALLQTFDGRLEKIRLQKLLFLVCKKQEIPTYEFIPYRYGCYSYSANADLTTMVTKGFLSEDKNAFQKKDKLSYIKKLEEKDQRIIAEIKNLYGRMSANALIKHTYVNFPYWAINSEIATTVLSSPELEKVTQNKTTGTKTTLFTIGYQGISLEEYLNRLVKNDVKVLVDVRRNPLSQKYGFSKSQLIKYCGSLGIKYLHIPEVGIQSELRQELNTQADYDKLFANYCRSLPKVLVQQQQILELLKLEKRIALTCFEADICQCHRKHLAQAIINLPDFKYELKHI